MYKKPSLIESLLKPMEITSALMYYVVVIHKVFARAFLRSFDRVLTSFLFCVSISVLLILLSYKTQRKKTNTMPDVWIIGLFYSKNG